MLCFIQQPTPICSYLRSWFHEADAKSGRTFPRSRYRIMESMASLLQRLNRQQNAYTKAKENIASHCEGVHGGQHGSGTEKGGKRRRLAPAPLGSTQVRATLSDHCEEKYPRHAKCAQQTVNDTRPPPPQAKGAFRAPGQDLDSGSGDPPLLARLRDARQRWAEAKRAAEVAGVRAKGLSGQAVCDPSEPPGEVEEEKEDCAAQILFEAVARARAEEPVDAEEGQEGGAREDMVAWLIRRVESSRAHTGRAEKEAEVSQEEEQPRQCGSGMRNMKDHPAEQEGSARVASALQRLKMRAREVLKEQADLDRDRGPSGAGTSRYTSSTEEPSCEEANIAQPSCNGWREEEVEWEEETW